MDEKIKKKIEEIDWWHTIDLGEYGTTNGVQKSIMSKISMPDNLTNKTVLDIGAVDGFYSFEAEKRNAKSVLAVDSLAWQKKSFSSHVLKTGKDGFNLAREVLNSKVKDLELNDFNEEICVEKVGTHDVVLCLGILYHMLDPFRFIRNLAKITNELLILETHTDVNNLYAWNIRGPPMMAFYPNDELNHDPTNWWGPNVACVMAMLDKAGFRRIKMNYVSTSGRAAFHAYK